WITARIFKYTKHEFWTAYGLSHAQADVTLPTLIIGLDTGLFDSTLFNAAIVMILLTSITSPLIVQRFGTNLQTASEDDKPSPLFERILVPIIDPRSQEQLIGLATLLAKVNDGKTIAVNVVKAGSKQENEFALHRDLLGRTPEILNDPQSEIELIPRLADTDAKGILYTAQEQNATIILMGWRGKRTLRESLLGSVLDEVIWGSDTPVMVGKVSVPLNGNQRVLFLLPPKVVPPMALRRMLEANLALAKALNVPLIVRADASYLQSIHSLLPAIASEHPIEVETLDGQLKPGLLEDESISSFVVVPGFGSRKRVADTLGVLPEKLAMAFDGNLAILHFDK
ncbi:MAG TPA: universal stress protein, partial [Anaerolineales bacterium]|nr:universal stress protein [Anaerolineales bacterium]